jgi:hypothetical protein
MNTNFYINCFKVNGVDCIAELPRTIYSNKTDFKDNGLSPFVSMKYNAIVEDLDLASDFGETGDQIYFTLNIDIEDEIECRGEYRKENVILG